MNLCYLFSIYTTIFILLTNISFSQGTWQQKADYPGAGRYSAASFVIGNKAYLGTGTIATLSGYQKDFWEYDPVNNQWTQKADLPGVERRDAVGFTIGNKGYIGMGSDLTPLSDFYEYDTASNSWTTKASYPGLGKIKPSAFVIGENAYVVCGVGTGANFSDQVWRYKQSTDTWEQKANFPGTERYEAIGFSINGKGYFGTGNDSLNNALPDFWEYDTVTDSWTQKPDFAGTARWSCVSLTIDSLAYVGIGISPSGQCDDIWEYDPVGESWTWITDFTPSPVSGRWNASAFSIGGSAYITIGADATGNKNDLWVFCPDFIAFAGDDAYICLGDTVTLNASGGSSYLWSPSTGLNDSTSRRPKAFPADTATYIVTVTNIAGCSSNDTVTVFVKPVPVIPVISPNDTNLISDQISGNQWYLNDSLLPGDTNQIYTVTQNGTYAVCITGEYGCYSCSLPFDFLTINISEFTKNNKLIIYPNPCSNLLTIKAYETINSIEIFDITGRKLYSALHYGKSEVKIDISQFPPGSYFIKSITENQLSTDRFNIIR